MARKVAGTWEWGKGHKQDDLMVDTKSQRHGNRMLGGQDHTSIPIDFDITKLMPLPWVCPRCGNAHLMYVFACNRCGYKTPIGDENWRR